MALDFPNTPTLNQVFTAPNGAMWMWDGAKWTAIASVSQYAANTNVGRNLIHNPLFNVAQRGAGPWTTGVYTLDRWLMTFSGGTSSVSQTVASDATRTAIGDEAVVYQLNNVFTGSATVGSYTLVLQAIEDVRRLSGKTVTLSFWAIALSGTPKLGVSVDQVFGTGGSPSTPTRGNGVAVTVTTAWQRFSVTLAIPSVVGKTLGTNNDHSTVVNLWFSAEASIAVRSGSIGVQSGSIFLWGVQLEVGSVATPLEKPDPRYDLANCQRFYQAARIYGYFYGVAAVTAAVGYAIQPMRTNPTCVVTQNSSTNLTGPSVIALSNQGVTTSGTATATTYGFIDMYFTASADL